MATDTVKNAIDTQVKNLEEKTGKNLDEWIHIVNSSGLEKHGEMVAMLKEKHGMGHGYANMVVHLAKQSHAGFSEAETLINEQYKGKEAMRPWYDAVMKAVQDFGPDVDISPKKAYVSLRRKKQFAILQPSTKTRFDMGLNLKNATPGGGLEEAGSWNSMCKYRVKIESEKDITADVIGWLRQAYEEAG
jgi:predicted transport protein